MIWYSIAANKNERRQTLKYRGNLNDDSGIYHPVCTFISKFVTLVVPGRDDLILGPEEAFDLFDFLFAYRNLLAALSAEIAERHCAKQD